MQYSNIIHAVTAVLYVAMMLGHIYLGSVGVEGAYECMRTDGKVDEQWAKEHHEHWYNEVVKGRPGAAGAASAARAAAMKEGWKL
jgi:formate dehydrogenase subunit gamma